MAPPTARQRIVYRAKYVPAADLVPSLQSVLNGETRGYEGNPYSIPASPGSQPVLVADGTTNSLIVSATEEQAKGLLELVEQLDRQPAMVRVQVIVAEAEVEAEPDVAAQEMAARAKGISADALLKEIEAGQRLRVVAAPVLQAIENQTATVQFGEQRPRIVGASITPRGGTVNQVNFEEVGLVLGITPRVNSADLITLEISLEQSRPGLAAEGVAIARPAEGEEARVTGIEQLQVKTTIQAQPGSALLLGGLRRRTGTGWRELLLLVTPTLVESPQRP